MGSPLGKFIQRFSSIRMAVIGDFIADEFIHGATSRISREAPVLVLDFIRREVVPGGGGNAAMNAAALGGNVRAIGALGADEAGGELRRAMERRQVDTGFLLADSERVTPTKTRIMAGGRNTKRQQVIRVDQEMKLDLSEMLESKLILEIEQMANDGLDAFLISDYGLGVVTKGVKDAIRKLSTELIITVDSRYAGDSFLGVTAITPNEQEVEELLGYWPDEERLDEAGASLLGKTGARAVLLTRGDKGMSLFEDGSPRADIPIYGSDQVLDVTGAGDTVIAAFTLSLAAGASMREAAELANRAAGLAVMKAGTTVVEPHELLATFEGEVA
ncbi:MAG: bifunctional ADP-heptose synthase [Nitrospinae bacterium]|nr:bifunctional ADP-heptose synthase [Nitrospinota bacterium]